MKPRSKRNRKRPRSERQQEELVCTTSIVPLELDGKPILSSSRGNAQAWIRMVEPYPYTFTSFAKARWVGRTALDVYSTEFGSYPKSYYDLAIRKGRIRINDETVPIDRCIQQHDVLSHTVHRHEPAVAVASDQAPYVHIVHESETILAVDKPDRKSVV